jgi:hypothetical protein
VRRAVTGSPDASCGNCTHPASVHLWFDPHPCNQGGGCHCWAFIDPDLADTTWPRVVTLNAPVELSVDGPGVVVYDGVTMRWEARP